MRDYYNLPPNSISVRFPHHQVINIIASKLNTSFVHAGIWNKTENVTNMFMYIIGRGKVKFSLDHTLKNYGGKVRVFMMSPQYSYKFTYCATRQKYVDNVFSYNVK